MASLRVRTIYNPLGAADVHALQRVYTQIALDFVFFGIQTAFSIAAASVLARRAGRSHLMLVAIGVLFFCAAISVITNALYYLVQLPVYSGKDVRSILQLLFRLDIVGAVTARIEYVLSDAIVVWRAWVIWSDSRIAKGILLLCTCGSLVGAILDAVWHITGKMHPHPVPKAQPLTMLILLMLTNVVATILVAIKVWQYFRDIKSALGLSARKSQVERVLVLLLESGCFYSVVWISFLAVQATIGTSKFTVAELVASVVLSISGIYPTIVVLTAMYDNKERSLLDSAQISHAMRFADGDKAHGQDTRATMDDDFALSGPSTATDGSIEPSIRMYDMTEVDPSSHGESSEGMPRTSMSG
ncbi:hypothetical protein GGG16DRAFT_124650 [Schizophyllum commune]